MAIDGDAGPDGADDGGLAAMPGHHDASAPDDSKEAAPPPCVSRVEVCDGADNDCDALVDENVSEAPVGSDCSAGQGACKRAGKQVCRTGVVVCDAVSGPSSAEVCDNIDNDCDGAVDEESADAMYGAACSGGQGACSVSGTYVCSGGKLSCSAPVMPTVELCDNIDNDCNGSVDDSIAFADKGKPCTTAEAGDCQGSGFYECDLQAPTKLRCTAVVKPKTCGSSCAPPPSTDCEAGSDECAATGSWVCNAASSAWECSAVAKPKTCLGTCAPLLPEVCGDGIDNDCKNGVDDGCGPAVVNWFKDCDGDGFANSVAGAVPSAAMPAPITDCLGWTSTMPDEATHTNWDCDDRGGVHASEAAKYHPGADFSDPASWIESFDFNCDGVETLGPKKRTRYGDCPAELIAHYNATGNCLNGVLFGSCGAYMANGKMTNDPPVICPDYPVIVAGPAVADPWSSEPYTCTVGTADAEKFRYTCK